MAGFHSRIFCSWVLVPQQQNIACDVWGDPCFCLADYIVSVKTRNVWANRSQIVRELSFAELQWVIECSLPKNVSDPSWGQRLLLGLRRHVVTGDSGQVQPHFGRSESFHRVTKTATEGAKPEGIDMFVVKQYLATQKLNTQYTKPMPFMKICTHTKSQVQAIAHHHTSSVCVWMYKTINLGPGHL